MPPDDGLHALLLRLHGLHAHLQAGHGWGDLDHQLPDLHGGVDNGMPSLEGSFARGIFCQSRQRYVYEVGACDALSIRVAINIEEYFDCSVKRFRRVCSDGARIRLTSLDPELSHWIWSECADEG